MIEYHPMKDEGLQKKQVDFDERPVALRFLLTQNVHFLEF